MLALFLFPRSPEAGRRPGAPLAVFSLLLLSACPACVPSPVCARFCTYPQELGFAFDGTIALSQVQLLSHQFKIAQRVELYVGMGPEYGRAEFKRLGWAAFFFSVGCVCVSVCVWCVCLCVVCVL